jgi:hypothetical protein
LHSIGQHSDEFNKSSSNTIAVVNQGDYTERNFGRVGTDVTYIKSYDLLRVEKNNCGRL